MAIESWAAMNGVRIAGWFEDLGVSGARELEDREGLVAAIASLRVEQAGTLVIAKRDRLARDPAICAMIERAVRQSGGRVVTADGVGNGDGPADAFLRAILDAVAAYERELIRARTRAAMAVKRAKGERTGKTPYGFALADDGIHLVLSETEQEVVAHAKELRARGMSVTKIGRRLEALGILTREGRPWHPQQIVRLLR
ncbi:recombinase family protein [Pendulispora brunnea]|uniref:Recombinase family protein n=2 Tax=Pendulispora brunnea TaxID=2905690 RepID=A0ABZ2K789_9BACT